MNLKQSLARWAAVMMTVTLTFVALPSGARAETAAAATVTVNSMDGTMSAGQSITYGYEFRPTGTVRVTAVGVLDLGSEGLNNDHPVGIWDTAGTLLVSGTVPTGTTVALSGGFRYVSVTPITLQAGQTYVIGAYYPGRIDYPGGGGYGNPSGDDAITGYSLNGSVAYHPCITDIVRRNSSQQRDSISFPYEINTYQPGTAFFGPNFLFETETACGVNQAPIAAAGLDQNVNEGTLVSLDGSASSDPDGDAISYAWLQTGGSPVTLSDPSAPAPTFTAPPVGPAGETLSFQLTVSDGTLSATAHVNVIVLAVEPVYSICTLYDDAKPTKVGATKPIKLQLCDAAGNNLSDPSLVLHATNVVMVDDSVDPAAVEDAGNANPDDDFRYDAALAGYIFNLSTGGLSPGTWAVQFTVNGGANIYEAQFAVK